MSDNAPPATLESDIKTELFVCNFSIALSHELVRISRQSLILLSQSFRCSQTKVIVEAFCREMRTKREWSSINFTKRSFWELN